MVKDSKHRTRAISTVGEEIAINDKRSVFTFIAGIQEEVHRFAIGYHRQLKKKNTYVSELTSIPGIGEAKAKSLMKAFGSVSKISRAEVEELEKVSGINHKLALMIYKYFRS